MEVVDNVDRVTTLFAMAGVKIRGVTVIVTVESTVFVSGKTDVIVASMIIESVRVTVTVGTTVIVENAVVILLSG